MQIPIISGIYADADSDFRTSYPINMEPIPKPTGISDGYLRLAEGIEHFGTGPGVDRGGINWRDVCYRVMGTKFCRVASNGVVTVLGDVGGGGPVSMSYGFDYLAIASGGRLYLFDGTLLKQNVDPDLGDALNVQWIDGYFMTTDGENLVVTELGDPFSVNPFKYGSSEVDPDPVKAVMRLNNEMYAINRHTIEAFTNVGGNNFPFQVIDGTQVYRGAVGTFAASVFMNGIAFVGSGRNEAPAVYLFNGGSVAKISTREIDIELAEQSEESLAETICEVRTFEGREVLYIHIGACTWCFDGLASQAIGQPVWFCLTTNGRYMARYFVRCYDKWICGHPLNAKVGEITHDVTTHWGEKITWQFSTPIIYNQAKGAQIHALEMIGLTGGAVSSEPAHIETSYSSDGLTWSQPEYASLGAIGERYRPVKWTRQGLFRNRRMQRFRGDSNAKISIAAIEAELEPLAW